MTSTKSLSDKNTNFFLHDWRILPPPNGVKVFDQEQSAANDLAGLLKDRGTPASIGSIIQSVMDASTGATIRNITTVQDAAAFPTGDDDSSKLPPWSVTPTSLWSEKDNSGQIAKDGGYNDVAFGRIVNAGDGKKRGRRQEGRQQRRQ